MNKEGAIIPHHKIMTFIFCHIQMHSTAIITVSDAIASFQINSSSYLVKIYTLYFATNFVGK